MAWHVVRYTPDKFNSREENRFYCSQGDIIKFGRVRFRIRKLRINDNDCTENEEADDIYPHESSPFRDGNNHNGSREFNNSLEIDE